MEIGAIDPTPDLEDVFQEDPAGMSVPVRGEGTFLTTELPARRVQMATEAVPIAVWTQLLGATPKRKRTVIISTDKPFYVSAQGTGTTGMLWPANVTLTLLHTERIFVMSADPATVATLSHFSELWAD